MLNMHIYTWQLLANWLFVPRTLRLVEGEALMMHVQCNEKSVEYTE